MVDQLEAASELRIDGDPVDRLEWDVKIGLTMNGALHDAAIAAWGAKAYYDYARPISMIRYLGERALLNEIPGVIETITPESSAPGERHTSLAEIVGEQAVYTWWGPAVPTDNPGRWRCLETSRNLGALSAGQFRVSSIRCLRERP